MLEHTRQRGEKVTTERCYYVSSKAVKAAEMARLIRAHWGCALRDSVLGLA